MPRRIEHIYSVGQEGPVAVLRGREEPSEERHRREQGAISTARGWDPEETLRLLGELQQELNEVPRVVTTIWDHLTED